MPLDGRICSLAAISRGHSQPVALEARLFAWTPRLLLLRTNSIISSLVAAAVLIQHVSDVVIMRAFTGMGCPAVHRRAVAASPVAMLILFGTSSYVTTEKPLCRWSRCRISSWHGSRCLLF